ncbi:MAG: glycosyltransferase family 2 protein [Deltaproteobacteria bacterium]|nr:MAG: glycosyltransferase family 2 protein [Deltaproteobacteria bacterium]
MANYNHGHYLNGALEAILAQSLQPDRIIVVDDASTDNSLEVLGNLARRYKHIRIVQNQANTRCFAYCQTIAQYLERTELEYVYLSAADERVLPGFFEKSIGLLEKFPKAGMCVSWLAFIDEIGHRLAKDRLTNYHSHDLHVELRQPIFLSPAEVLKRLKRQPWFIGGMAPALLRRSALADAGGHPLPEMKLLADWYVVHFIALKYGMCYLPQTLVEFRLVADSMGRQVALHPEKVMQDFLSALRLLEDPKNRQVFPPPFIEANRRNFSYTAFRGSFIEWHFKFHEDLRRLAPPKTLVDKCLKRIMHGFMRVEQLLLKFYCFRNVPAAFYEKASPLMGSLPKNLAMSAQYQSRNNGR